MDKYELRQQIIERFTAPELVELLGLEVEEILEMFWDDIHEFKLGVVLEELGYDLRM